MDSFNINTNMTYVRFDFRKNISYSGVYKLKWTFSLP